MPEIDLQELVNECHAIAVDRGFYARPVPEDDAIVWRQLCHLLSEVACEAQEAIATGDEALIAEELADVVIVTADLLGYLGEEADWTWDVKSARSLPDMIWLIARTMREFRKMGKVYTFHLIGVIGACFRLAQSAGINLEAAIAAKMEKNKKRPYRYGLADSGG